MSKQNIELDLEDLKKMQDIFDYCQASAERIAALTPTIQQFHTGAVPGELAAFSEEPGIYADLREAQWLLSAENHTANMMGLYWIKAIIRARCHAEGVPIAFNSEEEKELASAKHSGPASNETEIHINPIAIDEYIKAVSGGGESAYPTGKPADMLMGRALNAEYVAELVETTGIDKETLQGILKRSFLCELKEVDFYTLIGAAIAQGSIKQRMAGMLVKIVNNPKDRKQWRQEAADMLAEYGYDGKIMLEWQEPFQVGQASTKMARDSEGGKEHGSRTKLNADPTNQQAEAWGKICALLDELRPGWIDGNIKGVDSALKTIATMAEKADFAEVKPDLYLTGFQWKDSQGAWQFALGPAGSAWYESQGFKTRFVYVTQKD